MGSKMAIVIVALFAMLLFISPEVACRNFKEGEVVKETNEESDARLAGSSGGDLDKSYCPVHLPLMEYRKWIGNCRCGCCQWTTEPEVCLYCCPESHVPDLPSRPRAY
ncbi:hypothetical protein GLYMA_02G265200v4 [Glycine max]|uniref:Nodulin-16 n=1 Tax=Glycine max TaxID=3847 RepID=C6T4U2_SOYBN|nr:nodulin-16 precursor [Glycine max]XP_028217947.1 nodulin-16 isoform X2 [Glycine soja]ACU16713.1 unknown [Glycine max]KAH1062222.1 hypothetical protein GYH30_005296 [Glycine max]KHN38518.1 Nodulin-16 [Glycine soja]KRH73297.1 hypothetical protein GLYMA_02G265200v4 [Glycine max]|eukprot:NP_001238498.1 nodulin-16 precursor [Glycine max]